MSDDAEIEFGDIEPDDSFDAGDEDAPDDGPMTEDQQGYPGGEAS